MSEVIDTLNNIVWGLPALLLIVGVGVYLSIRTGFVQITFFPRAIKMTANQVIGKKAKKNECSPYRALCTALAATVGTGNLAGVAGAICIGGPGAIFWMWICALLGMVIKYAEAVLAVRYRKKNSQDEWVSGPMYMIEQGLNNRWKWLGGVYAFFCVVASFGVGNAAQVNTVIGSIDAVITSFGGNVSILGNLFLAVCLALLVYVMFAGGANRIGATAEKLVPFASAIYLLMCLCVLGVNFKEIPSAFCAIVSGAIDPGAITGGVIGSAFCALRVGASRGVFTNEAGMGTAGIAHGAASVEQPVKQGFMGIIEVFVDTIVICTMTAMAILCSGVSIPYGTDNGIQLTIQAFCSVYGHWASVAVTLCVCCFAVATILGWGLYGMRSAQYLFGDGAWKKFLFFQVAMVVVGAILRTGTVWKLSEIVNGLMAIPNLVAIAMLSPELIRLTTEYKRSPV